MIRLVFGIARSLLAICACVIVWWAPSVCAESEPPLEQAAVSSIPPRIALKAGEIRTVKVDDIERIAVGNPEVLDVTIVSLGEILIQARTAGTTNLIFWDRLGQHVSDVTVLDPSPEAFQTQLQQLMLDVGLPTVEVKREGNKLFLVGEVSSQRDLDQLEQMLEGFPGVINLAKLSEAPPPLEAGAPPPLVKLAVQVLEISRSDVEQLGVKWSETVTFTEATPSGDSLSDALMRVGESVTRNNLSTILKALVTQNKARVLSEPTLVTASGKEASSFIGLEIPIVTATSFGTTTSTVSASIEFRKTGVLLRMTPTVRGERPEQKVTTVIEAEVSGKDEASGLRVPVGTQTVLVPGFKVRKANTEVTTAPGESVVIAGLLEAEDSKTLTQVPALGGIPVLGRLFRDPELKSTRREIIIVVTPQILAEGEEISDRAFVMEQALVSAEVAGSVADPILRYALQVQDRIAKSIRFPVREQELGMSGRVKLRLHIFRDGTLGQATVSESSGIQSFDAEAMKAAESQSPYPAFPPELVQQDLWVEVPVLFRP